MAMGGGLLILTFFTVWVGAMVVWIMALVEVAKIPEHQFRAAGTARAGLTRATSHRQHPERGAHPGRGALLASSHGVAPLVEIAPASP